MNRSFRIKPVVYKLIEYQLFSNVDTVNGYSLIRYVQPDEYFIEEHSLFQKQLFSTYVYGKKFYIILSI